MNCLFISLLESVTKRDVDSRVNSSTDKEYIKLNVVM